MLLNILKPKNKKQVALIATGDELTNGDSLNTNTYHIAQTLTQNNIHVGTHAMCSDEQSDIKKTLVFLLKSHDAVIMTGGLGPTSDDRTRFALSAALHKPLMFDQASWQHVQDYIKQFSTRTPPESNKQQALFPKGAIVFDNPNGTARGCSIYVQGKWIFMLPGPPNECLTMFDTFVLPKLREAKFPNHMHHQKWLTFNVSEGQLATEIDNLVDGYDVTTGYRLSYPYLEIKLHGNNFADFNKAKAIIDECLKNHIIGDGTQPVSDLLLLKLQQSKQHLFIEDHATGGLMQTKLLQPNTQQTVSFNQPKNGSLHIVIKGLEAYWQQQQTKETTINISINQQTQTYTLPYRGKRSLQFAVEIICQQLLGILI